MKSHAYKKTIRGVNLMYKNQKKKINTNLQFQQRQIRIAIIRAIFTLLRDIVLKHRRRLGVISIKTVEDGIDILRPIGRSVESYAHNGKREKKVEEMRREEKGKEKK